MNIYNFAIDYKEFKRSLYLAFFCLSILSITSCRTQSRAYLYHPDEVAYLSRRLDIPLQNTNQEDAKNIPLYVECMQWLNTPYKYGGNTKRGVDCSGLVVQVYQKIYDIKLPRTTIEMYNKYKKIDDNKLKAGDLIFFATGKNRKKASHVGIYFKDKKFIHASTKKGVIVSHLDEKYYKDRKLKGLRAK